MDSEHGSLASVAYHGGEGNDAFRTVGPTNSFDWTTAGRQKHNPSGRTNMRFAPYEQLDSIPHIIVDGAATVDTVLTLSHWPKSGTPSNLKRDTSAEIVFAYLDSPSLHVQADAVSNNHFDEDGLVGIFALIDLSMAEKYRDLLMDAARAGDFGVYEHRDAARIAFTISAYADSNASPLPKEIFELPHPQLTGRLYEHLLELFPRFLTDLDDFKQHWEEEDAQLSASEELIARGEIAIEEQLNLDLAIIHIPENLAANPVHRLAQARSARCHPMALHNRTDCSRLLIEQGQAIEFQYRYESWVQLASRRPLLRVDLSDLAGELNQEETSGGRWKFDGVDRITPQLHLEGSPATSISPRRIQMHLEQRLSTGKPAWNPYD
jgi:hypothetical protein